MKPNVRIQNRSNWTQFLLFILIPISILALSTIFPTFLPRLSQVRQHLLRRTTTSFRSSSSSSSSSGGSSMSSSAPYSNELQIALLAVQRASLLTKAVYNTSAKGTLSKSDHSPVTIGDFGAQALIISALKHNFPNDAIVAEEDADSLKANEDLRNQVWSYVQRTSLEDDDDGEKQLGGPVPSIEAMLTAIDGGNSTGGPATTRFWSLDPIDGTKGFLRGGQYAIALALVVDGRVRVGVLGCPNLPVDDATRLDGDIGHDQRADEPGRGVLTAAVLGHGATNRPLGRGSLAEPHAIAMRPLVHLSEATFCESVEAAHSNHGEQAEIAKRLGITRESVRMDSQAKYASVARGAGDIYLRLPVGKTYQEKIWDHAAGELIVKEAGGEVTDMFGKALDFGQGRTLSANRGFVVAPKEVHAQVLEAVQSVLGIKL